MRWIYLKDKIGNCRYIFLFVITFIGAYLRFHNLAINPLWIDEVIFYNVSQRWLWYQELVPVLLLKIESIFANTHSEFWLRFPFALAGTLSIPAFYFILRKKNETYGLVIATIYSLLNPFVFYNQLARPYTIAVLVVILSWRYFYLFPIALFCSPISLIGVNFFDLKKYGYYLFLLILAIIIILSRSDSDKDFFNIGFLINAKRMWVLYFTSIALHLGECFHKNGSSSPICNIQ